MKFVIITGSTKGIGKSIALKFLQEGYYVIANYGSDDQGAKTFEIEAREISERSGGDFRVVKKQLSSYEAAMEFSDEILTITKGQKIDSIIFNCGATDRKRFVEIKREVWENVINTNLNTPFYLLQNLYDKIEYGGRIIFIGSIMGIYPHASSLSYAITKAAIHQMAKELVKVFADREITVNAIASGFVDTTWQQKKLPEQRKRIEDKIALHRFAKPEEIARLCWEIHQNGYLNGSVIEIDGGYCYR